MVTLSQSATVTATFGAMGPPSFTQEAYLKDSQPFSFENFGISVAVSGDTVAVGVPGDRSSESTGSNGGQVSIFARSSSATNWGRSATLRSSNKVGSELLGESVAVDASTLAAVLGNRIEIFTKGNGGQWSALSVLECPGTSPSFAITQKRLTLDGNTLVFSRIGFPLGGGIGFGPQICVFDRSNQGEWALRQHIQMREDTLGFLKRATVSLSGNIMAIGDMSDDSDGSSPSDVSFKDSGAVRIYTRDVNVGSWNETAYIKPNQIVAGDEFGTSVQVEGDTLVVGSPTHSNLSLIHI